MARWLVFIVFLGWVPGMALSQSLFAVAQPAAPGIPTAQTSSLFLGQRAGSLFAPSLPPAPPQQESTGNAPVDRLLTLIAQAEAGPEGYNAVQYGARVRPPRPPSTMTLSEIYDWIAATPGQPHAIGRYQFIPSTLHRVAAERGFGGNTRFTPGVQDALALVLLEDAGFMAFETGALDRREFMHNLARIWAGLPLPDGRSYYHGHAGNRATMTWAAFEGGMREIWGG